METLVTLIPIIVIIISFIIGVCSGRVYENINFKSKINKLTTRALLAHKKEKLINI
tara:strand:+ start:4827 stop:4994 length:168 start_codon:yes stop_codon:yes gene_type:complete